MAVWTIVRDRLVFSYALYRVKLAGLGPIDPKSDLDPLNVTIDPHLLILMGISASPSSPRR